MNKWLYLGLCLVSMEALAAGSNWRHLADITRGLDSNLSQGDADIDQVEDGFTSLTWTSSYNHQRNILSAWNFTGFAEFVQHDDVEGYDQVSAGGKLAYRFQPKLGFTEPFYEFSAGVAVSDFEQDQRDLTRYTLQVHQTRRITDKLTRTIGLEHRHEDSDGTVFDLQRTRWFINGELQINQKTALYSTYSFLVGEIASSAFTAGNGDPRLLNIINNQDASETDDVLTTAFGEPAIAYRLNALSHALSLGTRINLPKKFSVDASLLGVASEAEGDASYQRLISRITIFKAF